MVLPLVGGVIVGGKLFKFKKETKYPHKRSEGITRRGEARQERLMLGREFIPPTSHISDECGGWRSPTKPPRKWVAGGKQW
jgi:hypothetical protein